MTSFTLTQHCRTGKKIKGQNRLRQEFFGRTCCRKTEPGRGEEKEANFTTKPKRDAKHKTRRGGGGDGDGDGEEMGAAESRRDVHTEYVFGSASD